MKKIALALPLCLLGWTTASAEAADVIALNVEYPQEACAEIVNHNLLRMANGQPGSLDILCRDGDGRYAAFVKRGLPPSVLFGPSLAEVERLNFIPGDVNTLRVRWAE